MSIDYLPLDRLSWFAIISVYLYLWWGYNKKLTNPNFMVKHCKCNPHKTENEFCDSCGKKLDECVCDNPETLKGQNEGSEEN